MAGHVFISHSNQDADLVAALGKGLEEHGSAVWVDHRELAPGDLLSPETFAALGGRVQLEILGTPTLAGLSEALAAAERPYHVVHFDGHGVYNRERGLGALCFEEPADAEKLEGRQSDLVDAWRWSWRAGWWRAGGSTRRSS